MSIDTSSRPADPDTWFDRPDTATELTKRGFRTTAKTFATGAVRGGGPPYQIWGGKTLYRWADTCAWAMNRLETPRRRQRRDPAAQISAEASP